MSIPGSEVKIKCPKCRGNSLNIVELWKDHSILWECTDGILDRREGILEPGNPYKVECTCKNCGYHWTVRGAIQMGDKILR